MSKNLVTSKSLKTPEKAGEYHRLLCLTGKNKGLSYYLTGQRVVLGRSKTADIQILDPKSSREHAEIVLVGSKYVVTDLNSQNGVMINDLKVKQHELKTGDTVIIGKTVLKYSYINVSTPVVIDEDEDDEDDEEDFVDEEFEDDTKPKSKKGGNKNRLVLYIAVLGVLAFVFLGDSGEQKAKKISQRTELSDVSEEFVNASKKKMSVQDKETQKKLLMVLHNGLREYRERNYFRAIREFELALMLSPNNARASFYLNKTRQAMDDEIEKNFMKAKRDTNSLKYRGAVVSYCAIIKLLEGYPNDQRYKDAEENIEYVTEKMGLDKGEISCF